MKQSEAKQTVEVVDVPFAVSCSVAETRTESDSDSEEELEPKWSPQTLHGWSAHERVHYHFDSCSCVDEHAHESTLSKTMVRKE